MRGLTEACYRPVVANIVLELRRHGLRLEVAAHLLLEVADLVENVALDLRPFRVVAVARVAALAERNWDRALCGREVRCVAPADDAVLTD